MLNLAAAADKNQGNSSFGTSEWVAYYRAAMSILLDDENRRLHGLSMTLDVKTLLTARRLEQNLYACLSDPQCTDVARGHDDTRLSPTYARLHDKIGKASTAHLKRDYVKRLLNQVRADVAFQDFSVNDGVRVEGNTLHVPMDPGAFAGYEFALAAMVEPIWQTPNAKVRITWTTRNRDPLAFVFQAHQFGGRAFVDRSRRTVNFFDGDTPKTIAHEFGHVLGLPDHYYTTWDEATCMYTTMTDDDDIMSNHETGKVTPALWQELADVYGLDIQT